MVPVTETAREVSITGVRWPLRQQDLTLGSTYTVSNEVTDHEIRVEITEGAALLFQDLVADEED